MDFLTIITGSGQRRPTVSRKWSAFLNVSAEWVFMMFLSVNGN
jgi:hypothetical protein